MSDPIDLPTLVKSHPSLPDVLGEIVRCELQSGLSNRVLRIEAQKGIFFIRLPQQPSAGAIDRWSEAHNLALAADLDLAVRPVLCEPETGLLLTRAVDTVAQSLHRLPSLLGSEVSRLHGSSVQFRGKLDPYQVFDTQAQDLRYAGGMTGLAEEVAALLQTKCIEADLGLPSRAVPSHGDLSPGNIILTQDRVRLIDWEFSGMAPPGWDLAYAIVENGFDRAQEDEFLESYALGDAKLIVPHGSRLEMMKALCDTVSGLWALGQVSRNRDPEMFNGFAVERLKRAFQRLKSL